MSDTITPEAGKTYLTRDGRKARCLCTDRRHDKYPVLCLVHAEGLETVETYTADGRFNPNLPVAGTGYDLVSEAPRIVTVEVWVELTRHGEVIDAAPGEFETRNIGNTIVKITQDVELPND
jgi:hypothetical protein